MYMLAYEIGSRPHLVARLSVYARICVDPVHAVANNSKSTINSITALIVKWRAKPYSRKARTHARKHRNTQQRFCIYPDEQTGRQRKQSRELKSVFNNS